MQCMTTTVNDRDRWNRFVVASGKGHIMQSYEWGEVLKAQGWQPFRIAVMQNNAIEAVMAVYLKKIPAMNTCIIYSPCGPVLNFTQEKIADCLIEGAKKVGAENKAVFLQLFPNVLENDAASIDAISGRGFVKIEKQGLLRLTQPSWVYKVDIGPSEKEILGNMKKRTRYSINFSKKKGITVEEKKSGDDLKLFYCMLRELGRRKNFPVRSFNYFRAIWKEMAPGGLARLFFAKHGDQVLAAEMAFVFGDTCYGMYRASSLKERNLRANYALVWGVMTWARERNLKWYDLRGVASFNPPETHSGYGVFKFKEGFGGIPHTYIGDYYHIFDKKRYRLWQAAETVFNRAGLKIINTFYKIRSRFME
jgi:lipid II:glycine glycyltransferase (peptidoglycan interpeptide bridge formation enzyme)